MKQQIKRNAWLFVPGTMLGIGSGLFLSGYWLFDNFPAESKQLLFFTVLASLIGIAGYSLLLGWMREHLSGFSMTQVSGLIGSGIFIGAIAFFAGTDQWQSSPRYMTLLLPTHTLQISVVAPRAGLGGGPTGETSLIWFNTALGDVSYDAINTKGWKREGDQLVLQDPSDNVLSWTGKPGDTIQLVFRNSGRNGQAIIAWDGQKEMLDLSSEKTAYNHSFNIPFYAGRPLILSLGLFNFALLSFALSLLIWKERAMVYQTIRQSFDSATTRWDTPEKLTLAGVILLALLLRIFNLGNLYPAVDEYYQLIAAKQILQGAALSSVYPRSLWMVTLPVTVALRIFGNQLWAARAVGVLFNVLAILPLYFLTRKINRPIAVLSSLLYAASPWIITFARVVREYAYYPFYFYLIILGMVLFLEGIPNGSVFVRDWKIFLKPGMGLMGLALIFPPIYGFYIDRASTFSTILLAYLVFGLFILLRFNLRDKRNLPILILMCGGILIGANQVLERHFKLLELAPQFNPFPIQYFFPNPQQQWYFDRFVILPVIGFLGCVLLCFLIRRINFIPLFVLTLYGFFLGFFLFFSKSFFHTRHLSTTELWYILLVAIGFYALWRLLGALFSFRGNTVKILLVVFMGAAVINPQETLLPVLSNNPDMPISEDYYHDMSLVQGYMLQHTEESDVLISTVYGLYTSWEGEPSFHALYRITSQTPSQDVFAIVDKNPSGWIVIDRIRLDQAGMTVKEYSGKDQIEYVGLFGDEYVWHWQHPAADTAIPGVLGKGQ